MMEKNENMLELCMWDFLSLEDALQLFPDNWHRQRYRVYQPFLQPTSIGETREVELQNNKFGFCSWVPIHAGDRAMVEEFKVKPKIWTRYKPISEQDKEEVKVVCSQMEAHLESRGFLVSCACLRDLGLAKTFVIAFAVNAKVPLSTKIEFSFSFAEYYLQKFDAFDQKIKEWASAVAAKVEQALRGVI